MCMSSQSSNGVLELAFVRDLVGACVGRLPETRKQDNRSAVILCFPGMCFVRKCMFHLKAH